MSMGNWHPRATRWSLAASLSLTLTAGLVGCGGTKEGSVDTAVVTVNEPSAKSSAAAPAAGETSPPAAPAETTPAATPAPAEATTAAAPAAGGAEGWGTLKGRVVLNGEAPVLKAMYLKGDKSVKDPGICAGSSDILDERLVVDPASKGVRYAVVYIPKPTKVSPEAESAAKAQEVVFDQKNCTFVPHVLAFMKGTKVKIKSSDAAGHNVNTQSGLNNNKFNLPTQPMGEMDQLFKQAENKPGKVVCDIHGWMSAYMLVASNPYFAVTDANGNFEIKNVPAGDQKVVVWAEGLGPGFVTAPAGDVVAIKADGETTQDFTLESAKLKLK